MPRILAFAGSCRAESLNQKLLETACRYASQAGAEVTAIRLRDFPIPLYDGEFEEREGVPAPVRDLRQLLVDHDGVLLACPEYNGSITPLLKNVIDWTSRPDGDAPGLIGYRGKTAALIAASPGALGGLRGLVHVRAILSGIGVLVTPTQFALGAANAAFESDGGLREPRHRNILESTVSELIHVTASLRAATTR